LKSRLAPELINLVPYAQDSAGSRPVLLHTYRHLLTPPKMTEDIPELGGLN